MQNESDNNQEIEEKLLILKQNESGKWQPDVSLASYEFQHTL